MTTVTIMLALVVHSDLVTLMRLSLRTLGLVRELIVKGIEV